MTPAPSPIEAAKARHRLAEVATRTGIPIPSTTTGTVTVHCPMPSHGHYDRTPSMRLYLDDDCWYCFACSTHAGDVIDWVTQTEQTDWRTAIAILDSGRPIANTWNQTATNPAHPYGIGVRVSEQPDLARTPPERVREAVQAAWDHCTQEPHHDRAATYLAGRGINLIILEGHTRRLEAGHTPIVGAGITETLSGRGFTTDELVDAGLTHRHPDGTCHDFYHHRLLLPIRNPNGELCGLVGRNTGHPSAAKYKNPPRTAIYNKSVNLYQPLPAPTSPYGHVIIVEGPIDALAIAYAAIQIGQTERWCAITQSGHELSVGQLQAAVSLQPGQPLVIAFDNDPAGHNATVRLGTRACKLGIPIAIATVSPGEDPASWLAQHGPHALQTWAASWAYDPTVRDTTQGARHLPPFATTTGPWASDAVRTPPDDLVPPI